MIKLKHDQNIRIKLIYIKTWTEFTTRMPILMDWILPTQPKRQHGQMTCAEVQTCLNCQFFETALVQSSIIFPAVSNRHSCALGTKPISSIQSGSCARPCPFLSLRRLPK